MRYRPHNLSRYVARPALGRRLDEALDASVTLLCAPAGAGKSVLLAQWVAAHPELDVVSLYLEKADDDPVHFIRRLLGRLVAVDPEFGEFASLGYTHGGGLGPALLGALQAKMDELSDLVLIFDNLHRLSNATLLGDIGRLIDATAPNVHFVLSSRLDPPFALSRYRLHRDLVEIRQSELAFDELEAAQLIRGLTGQALGPEQVTALVARTEGWVAGLQLAAITLKTHPEPDDFVAQFSGNDRLVADFLTEEVLRALPEDRRDLLFQMAVLDKISADLVHSLTGEARAQEELEALERDSMFLVALDNQREWYRFHQLFRDLLRYRYRAADPEGEAVLLAKAASWHIARDDVGPAVRYLLRARQWQAALDLIMSMGPPVFERGEMSTFNGWIDAIPESVRTDRVDVTLLRGIFEGITGHWAAADDILRRVAASRLASAGERACALAFLATLTQWRSDVPSSLRWAEAAHRALASLGDQPVPDLIGLTDRASLEALILGARGRASFLLDDTAGGRHWLERARDCEGTTYSLWKVHALGSLALLDAWCGLTDRAVVQAEEALGLARAVGMLNHPAPADAFLALSLAAVEGGEPEHALTWLDEGLLRAEANRRTQLLWIAKLIAAMVQGVKEGGAATMTGLLRQLGAPPPPIVAARFSALRARSLRLGGSPERALQVAGGGREPSAPLAVERAAAYLTLGRVDEAVKALEALPTPAVAERPLAAVERLTMLAWLAARQGRPDVDRLLDQALGQAEPHSLVEVFVRAGPPVVDLLAHRPGARNGFCGRVLRRARLVHDADAPDALAEALTDRELEILQHLPSRMTNAELADRCYVSLNTMKTHVARIYRKLDVANRTEAIDRARELGLLTTPIVSP